MEQQSNSTISVLIADDHQLFRSGLISLLDSFYDILVLDEASDGEELVEKYFKLHPDLIIVDITMPKLSGFEAFMEIKKQDPKVKALFVSMHDNEDYIFYAKKLGGKGLLGKNVRKDELIYAIKRIADGGKYFGREWDRDKLNELDSKFENLADANISPDIQLSSREKQILNCISEGMTSSEIAKELGLKKRTVDNHRARLMNKIKANSLTQLISFAIKYSSDSDIESKLKG